MAKILNFGSLNLDIVYSVDHIVRPGETTASFRIENFCGGKGLNQTIAAARAGSPVYHAGKIGADGRMLKHALTEAGADVSFLMETDGKTGNALIQRDLSGQNSIILFGGANQEITVGEIDEVLSQFGKGDFLISQNEISGVPHLLRAAGERGMRIVLNPSPMDETLKQYPLDGIEMIVINEVEGEEMTGSGEPDEIIGRLLKKYPGIKIVLTLGARGSVYADRNVRYVQESFPVTVLDTTGAGDTFLGYLAAGISEGAEIPAALKTAAAAAAIAVSRAGAVPSIPVRDEVEAFLKVIS